jgi:hypothetical protein
MHTSSTYYYPPHTLARNANAGKSGNTGSCTTGAHVHFEVRKDGVAQSIPGSVGQWVTRNANIPKDYAGLNNPSGATYVIDNASAGFSVVGSTATGSISDLM